MFNFIQVKECIISKKLLLRPAAPFVMRLSPVYLFHCLLLAFLFSRFAQAEAPESCDVAKIKTAAVGLNFVIFKGDVGRVFAGEMDSNGAKLKAPLLLNKSRAELPKIDTNEAADGLVIALFKKDGFRSKNWYVPFQFYTAN